MDETVGQTSASSGKRFPADHNYGTFDLSHPRLGTRGTGVQDCSCRLGHQAGCGRCQDVRNCLSHRRRGHGLPEGRIQDPWDLCRCGRGLSRHSFPSAESGGSLKPPHCGWLCRRLFLLRPCGIPGNEDRHQGECPHHPGSQDIAGKGAEGLLPWRCRDGAWCGWTGRAWTEHALHPFFHPVHGWQFCNRWRL